MKLYPFSALLARMKYITRWSLMHSTRPESLSEHTCDTALMAHILCLIARRYTGTPCRPKTVAVAALYHDAPEIITGDMPTPVKYSSPGLRDAYKALEAESVVENYIDSAVMAKLGTVTIIHGKGTGALRAAVQQDLKKNKFIKKFRLGQYGEGEDGVTIVTLA